MVCKNLMHFSTFFWDYSKEVNNYSISRVEGIKENDKDRFRQRTNIMWTQGTTQINVKIMKRIISIQLIHNALSFEKKGKTMSIQTLEIPFQNNMDFFEFNWLFMNLFIYFPVLNIFVSAVV